MPPFYRRKFYVLNLRFWGEAHASPFLKYYNFSLNMWLEMRHKVHPCKKNLIFLRFFYILLIFLSEKIIFCYDYVKCNVFERYSYVFKMVNVWL